MAAKRILSGRHKTPRPHPPLVNVSLILGEEPPSHPKFTPPPNPTLTTPGTTPRGIKFKEQDTFRLKIRDKDLFRREWTSS